jgi:glycosyltransferase involved in cell wall biosynthesis
MKISIALAVFNGEKYLQEQLQSFMLQLRLPDELIVCDDGSNDTSISIIEDFKKNAPFNVLFHRNTENLGYVKNFEKAIGYCTGDIIFLSDQDDVWLPEKIQLIEKIFFSTPEVMVVLNNMDICDEKLQLTGLTTLGQIRSAGMKDEVLSYGCCTAFRSSIKSLALPIPDSYSHDAWINQFGKSMGRWFLYEASLQLYRRHSSASSNWITSSPEKIKRQDLKSFATEAKPWVAYELRAKLLFNVRGRLDLCGPAFLSSQVYVTDLLDNIYCLDKEIEAIRKRVFLMKAGYLRRKLLALDLLFRGGYRNFSGLKSFAKDFLV